MLAELVITSIMKISEAEWLSQLCDSSTRVTATHGEERVERRVHPVYRTPRGDYALIDLEGGDAFRIWSGEQELEIVFPLDKRLYLVRAPPRSLPYPLIAVEIPRTPKETIDACLALALDGIAPPLSDVDDALCKRINRYTAEDPLLACSPSIDGDETIFFHGVNILRDGTTTIGINAVGIIGEEVFPYGTAVRVPGGGALGYIIDHDRTGAHLAITVLSVEKMRKTVERVILEYERIELRERLSE